MIKDSIDFIDVDKFDKSHHEVLFKILNSRKYNISHDRKVNYEDHISFVKNNPYQNWCIVNNKDSTLGYFYITYDNYIGVSLINEEKSIYKNIIAKILREYKPNPKIDSVRRESFCINSNPNNIILQNALEEIGLRIIQVTFSSL